MNGLVKLCGIARAEDVGAAVAAGADALGFIFWPKSPRAVSPENVAAWTQSGFPNGVLKVGVFVNQSVEAVRHIMEIAGLDVAQLHGDENADYVRALDRRAWKAVHLDRVPADLAEMPVEAVLVDSGTVKMPGGTGHRVDTDRAAAFVRQSPHPVLLAGGLTPENVAEAICIVRPAGVDVSSGICLADSVAKDGAGMRAFVQSARQSIAVPPIL